VQNIWLKPVESILASLKFLTIIILTKNEEKHLPRLLQSLIGLNADLCIIDTYSEDRTLDICNQAGAKIYQNPFVNHAVQFQWALDNCEINTPWVMRMDADEYLTPELANELKARLPQLDAGVTGVVLKRQVHFMGRWIRHGGYYPIKLLRVWRNGIGSIEQKWMDEHILLSSGKTVEFQHDLVDDNLNNLSWWTEKHNHYATREAIDLLNKEYGFFKEKEIVSGVAAKEQNERKRWYKQNVYLKSPLFLRAFLYFNYRYFLQLGFLDGRPGLIWHFLQGFWYRFLVDAKIAQIKWWAKKEKMSVKEVIEQKYNIKLDF
jgi:glycosyltransferase involved in cell wall biosynthesis